MRLIDADALLKALNETPLDFVDVGGDFGFFDETIDSVMNEQPTIDAVEVVRCKDCKHFNQLEKGCDYHGYWYHVRVEADAFCSYGERRTNEG